MGLLDDAIREHLELKRRRGADSSEIARLQHEALGPVRREPFGSAESEPGPEAPHARAATSDREDAQHEAEYEEYYTEEFSAEENGDDWGDAFAEDDLGARRDSRGRGEEPSVAGPEPTDEGAARRRSGDRKLSLAPSPAGEYSGRGHPVIAPSGP